MPYKTSASDLLHFADGVVSLGDKGTPTDGDMLIIQADGKAEFESVSSAGLQPHNANLDAASASPTSGDVFAAPGGTAAWSSLLEVGIFPILTPTATKTSLYTAAAGDLVCYDASGGTFSIKAPASPTDKVIFGIKEVGGSATAITLDGNGVNVDGAATLSFGIAYGSLTLQYSSTQSRWLVL